MTILITVGTLADKKFTRLFKLIDELCEEGILEGQHVLAQIGSEPYTPKYFQSFNMVDRDRFEELINQADIVITHGGSGTLTRCLKAGKKVIIFPRQLQYNEHFDNHQIELSEVFSKKGYALTAMNKEELVQCLRESTTFKPVPFQSNNYLINQLIIESIEGREDSLVGVTNLVRGLWTK